MLTSISASVAALAVPHFYFFFKLITNDEGRPQTTELCDLVGDVPDYINKLRLLATLSFHCQWLSMANANKFVHPESPFWYQWYLITKGRTDVQ